MDPPAARVESLLLLAPVTALECVGDRVLAGKAGTTARELGLSAPGSGGVLSTLSPSCPGVYLLKKETAHKLLGAYKINSLP
uniref:Uncharacterized protein n=1 Tax=Vombatus ursinus TaxID=29139 RepID=A0A4X2LQW5_VOMUR